MLFSDKRKADRFIVAGIALAWALFQLALPRLIILDSTTVRTVHLDWTGISMRAGLPIPRDIAASVILIVLLLEASRRAIGPAITIIAILFTLYAFLGSYMPMTFAFRGVSLRRYVSQMALSAQGIFGIPLHVSANTVFLFVLLGSMLERVGAGHFFNDLSLSLFGRFKGGAGKA
ncbi:MAG: TRAP transporter large permease subunit, partial [Planctomycetota bacterium]